MSREAHGVMTRVREALFERVRGARNEVMLVSPYLSERIANELVVAAGGSHALDLRLLTSLSSRATAAGVLSRNGLLTLLEAGFDVRSASDLHAKAWLVDRTWGLIGSGNLTASGLGGDPSRSNAELGVVLAPRQLDRTYRIVDRWWGSAMPLDAATIQRFPGPEREGSGRGETIGPSVADDLPSDLETQRARGERSGLWLKILHDAPGRYGPGYFTRRTMVNDRQRVRPDGRVYYRPSYERGDLLVVYVVQRGCPAILEVTRTAEYEPERVRRDPDALPNDWKRWTWVTEVRCLVERSLDVAPHFDVLGLPGLSVRRTGRRGLTVEQFAAARRAILSASP